MERKLNILDWYVHQGHQYEFFKTGHNFYLVGANKNKPKWNEDHRPLAPNVKLISEREAKTMNFDIVIIRSPIHKTRYEPFIKSGAAPIAVVQTTNVFNIPSYCKYVIWNSETALKNNASRVRGKKNIHIIHGYDPDEFTVINGRKNGRVLTVANVFKGRREIMGYDLWLRIFKDTKKLDVIGHGNEDMYRKNKEAKSLAELIKIYNLYSVYFNPTIDSAMPRSRAEAAMCGMPIVSTNYYDIGRYFKHGESAILSNNKDILMKGISNLLEDDNMREDFGAAAREVAIEHFHIKDFIQSWNQVFNEVIK